MPDGIPRAIKMMDEWGIDGMVNLSGMYPGPPRHMLETQLAAAAKTNGHMIVFANADFRLVRMRPDDYGKLMAEQLAESKRLGARGLKIPKGLGLGYPAPDGQHLLPIDDKGLDPLFEQAGALGMPVAIHVGDPKAFWLPPTPEERAPLGRASGPPRVVSFYSDGTGPEIPPWQALYDAFERRVARRTRRRRSSPCTSATTPEDPDNVARMLDKYPNFYIDTAARVPEMGRHDAAKMRAFLREVPGPHPLRQAPTRASARSYRRRHDVRLERRPCRRRAPMRWRFFKQTWRYFETNDKQVESPTPIQGRWKIDVDRLRRTRSCARSTSRNAVRVLGLAAPQGT